MKKVVLSCSVFVFFGLVVLLAIQADTKCQKERVELYSTMLMKDTALLNKYRRSVDAALLQDLEGQVLDLVNVIGSLVHSGYESSPYVRVAVEEAVLSSHTLSNIISESTPNLGMTTKGMMGVKEILEKE